MIHGIALFVSAVANAVSLVLLKSFALSGGEEDEQRSEARRAPLATKVRRLLDLRLLISLVLYAIAMAAWVVALIGIDLVVAYPTLAITYVVVALVAKWQFSEELSPNQWAALALIVAGVVVMHL